jgi:hypothetical protein
VRGRRPRETTLIGSVWNNSPEYQDCANTAEHLALAARQVSPNTGSMPSETPGLRPALDEIHEEKLPHPCDHELSQDKL